MNVQAVVLFATTLVAIVNPISSAVLFATMSGRFGAAIQRRMANQSAFAILVILLACAWAGRPLLLVLGISVPMLQAAGGLILLLYGLRMVTVDELKLTPEEQVSAEEVPEEQWKTLAVVPLAIPGTVGAGTIARRLGPIGLNVVTRVMGILVSATAFGLLGRGVAGLLPGLAR